MQSLLITLVKGFEFRMLLNLQQAIHLKHTEAFTVCIVLSSNFFVCLTTVPKTTRNHYSELFQTIMFIFLMEEAPLPVVNHWKTN